MNILIVTLTYNNPGLIKDLTASLKKHLPKNGWHHFIRDNSTNNETQELVKSLNDPRFSSSKFVNEGNYSSQHNDLMRDAMFDKYEHICLLNDDTIAMSDFITPMVKLSKSNNEVGAVGATLFYPDMRLQHCGVSFLDDSLPFNINFQAIAKLNLWPHTQAFDRQYYAVTGACLLIKVEDYKALGGMDEGFEWCFDDVDLCLRLGSELNKKCVTSSQAKLIHIENFSTLKNKTNLKPNFQSALKLIREKHKNNLPSDFNNYRMDYGKLR